MGTAQPPPGQQAGTPAYLRSVMEDEDSIDSWCYIVLPTMMAHLIVDSNMSLGVRSNVIESTFQIVAPTFSMVPCG